MLALVVSVAVLTPQTGAVARASVQVPAPPQPRPMVVPFEARGLVRGGFPLPGGTQGQIMSGAVTAVTATTITVAHEGGKTEVWTPDHNGRLSLSGVIVDPPQPPKTFTAVGPLAEREHLPSGCEGTLYRLSDAQVGDRVSFHSRKYDGVDEVHYVSITRRPGGRVPPCPAGDSESRGPWHERMNAIQAWEERREPIPDKYHPGGNEAGIAPMPRLAKSK